MRGKRTGLVLALTGGLSLALTMPPAAAQSVSTGTPARGTLRGGVSLPAEGEGFVSYSRLGNALGRQYVNSRVRDTLLAALAKLNALEPTRRFVIGETASRRGGRFRPHRSHQNGLSVDVFMPVRDGDGRRVLMPTPSWRKFGYGLEFDAGGVGEGLRIDFGDLAALLEALEREAARHGLAIDRIIVAPEYVGRILAAGGSGMTSLSGRFLRRAAWVRHDEHVHVDFRLIAGTAARPAAQSATPSPQAKTADEPESPSTRHSAPSVRPTRST